MSDPASSQASMQRTLARLDAVNPALGAFTYLDRAAAMRAAAAADERRRSAEPLSVVDGWPVAVKANIAVQGWPNTAGLRFRASEMAADDAFIVARLRRAGAIPIGLTNMDEGALGAEGLNPWYLQTQNPHRAGWSAGGSSSGSAAAVGAGLVPLALGTDTIGSLRIPASFCGICSIKPTYGLLSVRDVVPVHARFDHAGPMTMTIDHLKTGLRVLAAYDPTCKVSFPVQLAPAGDVGTVCRIAYAVGFDNLTVTDAAIAGYNRGIAGLRSLGYQLEPLDLSNWDLPRLRRAILALCELEMWRTYRQRIAEAPGDFSDALRAFIRFGNKLDADDISAAEQRIASFMLEFNGAMRGFAACILPTTPCCSFPQAERHPQNTADLTAIASATGGPALSLPMPMAPGEMPTGLQLIGSSNSDLELLRIAGELEAALAITGAGR